MELESLSLGQRAKYFGHQLWLSASVKGEQLNWEGEILRNLDLSEANLVCADLSGADMSGSDLSDSVLKFAEMSGSDLSGVNLRGANLLYANLSRSNLSGADLRWANLKGTDLSGAHLKGAIGIFQCGPIGSCGDIITAVEWGTTWMIQCNYLWCSVEEFLDRLNKRYPEQENGNYNKYDIQYRTLLALLDSLKRGGDEL